jgi:hypothetical protein
MTVKTAAAMAQVLITRIATGQPNARFIFHPRLLPVAF